MNKKLKYITVLLFFLGIIIFGFVINSAPKSEYTVTFIDVGQGDSTVISSGKASILIDAGTDKDARKIRMTLDRLKIKTLDLVILSHLDFDHINGMSELIGEYKIKKIITSVLPAEIDEFSTSIDELKTAVNLHKVKLIKAKTGDKFSIGGIDVNALLSSTTYKNSNDNSLVVKIKCGRKYLLFPGDISSKVEDRLVKNSDLKADILKVAHHGSYYSTTSDFLNAVNPSYAVVCVSEYNRYNLPNVEVMNRLYDYGCKVFRTDEMSNITFYISGKSVNVECEK